MRSRWSAILRRSRRARRCLDYFTSGSTDRPPPLVNPTAGGEVTVVKSWPSPAPFSRVGVESGRLSEGTAERGIDPPLAPRDRRGDRLATLPANQFGEGNTPSWEWIYQLTEIEEGIRLHLATFKPLSDFSYEAKGGTCQQWHLADQSVARPRLFQDHRPWP